MSELFLGHPFIAPVIELARQAGEVIMPFWRANVAVTSKSDNSPVTAADLAAHHLILAGLTALDPSIPVLSEEDADIAVGYVPSTSTKEDGTTLNLGLGTGSYGRSGGISLGSIFSIPVGEQTSLHQRLQIDMVKDGKFIYSAAGSTELDGKDSISIQNSLNELVSELLNPYPNTTLNTQ